MVSCVGRNAKKMAKHTIGVGNITNHGTTVLQVNYILSFSHIRFSFMYRLYYVRYNTI